MSDDDSMNLSMAEQQEDDEFRARQALQKECDHLWVRRRDGSWCTFCGECRFGQELSEEERERLRSYQCR